MENIKEWKGDFHHDKHDHPCMEPPMHHNDLYKFIMKELTEETKNRMHEDKNLHSIIHTLYHKLEGFEKVTIKDLEKKIDIALAQIPELKELVTDNDLRNILARYYTKYEIDAAFSTSPIKEEEIKNKAFEKLNKFISYGKL